MNDLKSCPFCGSSNIRIERSEKLIWCGTLTHQVKTISTRFKCFCSDCSCGTSMRYSEEDARAAWNRRADNGE